MVTMMDFFPIFARSTREQAPSEQEIAEYDLFPLITEKNAKSHLITIMQHYNLLKY
jgi:hypothetical protein